MHRTASLPFIIKRGDDVMSATEWTSTSETVHGLLRLEGDRLVIQWRVHTKTDTWASTEMRSAKEVGPVEEVVVPIRSLAGSFVRRRWWQLLTGPRLVLTASDLRAFEEAVGEGALGLDHPAEIVLRLRRSDRLAGEEFSAELALAIAQSADDSARTIRGTERTETLSEPVNRDTHRLPEETP